MLGPMKLPYWTLFAFFHYFVYPTTHTSECQADSCATAVRADKSSRSQSLSRARSVLVAALLHAQPEL